jgi:hypothetical protein
MLKRHMALLVALCAMLGILTTAAQGETTGPVWKILSVSTPTNFNPAADQNGSDAIILTAVNVGGSAAAGETTPITIADALPAGLTAVEVFGENAYHDPVGSPDFNGAGEATIGGLTCTFSPTTPSCRTSERVDPGDTLIVTIRVDVNESAPPSCPVSVEATGCADNVASVSGGGAPSASVSDLVAISSQTPAYGVAKGGLLAATSTSQAGAHPNVTNEFFLNTVNPRGVNLGGAPPFPPFPRLAPNRSASPRTPASISPPASSGQPSGWRAAQWWKLSTSRTVPATRWSVQPPSWSNLSVPAVLC